MPLPAFATGEPFTAAAANLIARQGLITVTSELERDALAGPHEGMVCYVEATATYYHYSNGGWRVFYAATRPYHAVGSHVTVGNGQLDAEWSQVGRELRWSLRFVLGSTSAITGGLPFKLPILPARAGEGRPVVVGIAAMLDASTSGAAGRRAGTVITNYSTELQQVQTLFHDGSFVNASTPWAWAPGDVLDMAGSYQVAD